MVSRFLSLVLFTLALHPVICAVGVTAQVTSPLKSFGMGYSQYAINTTEQTFFTYNLTGGYGVLSHAWFTGGPFELIDTSIWSYYIDGESTPSIQSSAAMFAGTGFDNEFAPWGHRWFGKGADGAAWYNNFRVPFHKSIRITGRLSVAGGEATLWTIFRGTENLPIQVGGITLPTSARLVQQRTAVTSQPLDFVSFLDVPTGNGVLFSHTLVVQSGNQNFLEGCYHGYTPYDQQWPGITMSTGTEDYFDSAFYFNAGVFRQENAGLTYYLVNSSLTQVSAYRMHDQDPVFFTGGFRFVWRNGDVVDDAGHKCTLQTGGQVSGDPQVSDVTAHTWAYTWPASDAPSGQGVVVVVAGGSPLTVQIQ